MPYEMEPYAPYLISILDQLSYLISPICLTTTYSKKLLSRENVSFSKGSLAANNTSIFSDAASFKEIPFQHVYHDSWFEP